MKRLLYICLVTALAVITFLASATAIAADQYGQYGGTPVSQSILIDKMVGFPTTTSGLQYCDNTVGYADNFSINDTRFKPSDRTCFRLRVKNTSNVKQYNVIVHDFMPSFIDPIQGPGAFDANARTVTFNAGDFDPDQEKTYFMMAQWAPQDKLPSDKSLICVTNRVEAKNDNVSDDDTAQVCVEKHVQNIIPGISKAPAAGPELGIFLFAAELSTLAAGIYLKRAFA